MCNSVWFARIPRRSRTTFIFTLSYSGICFCLVSCDFCSLFAAFCVCLSLTLGLYSWMHVYFVALLKAIEKVT